MTASPRRVTTCALPLALAFVGGWACTDDAAARRPLAVPTGAVVLALDPARVVAEVDPRYLSFAVDTSQVVGGHWWSADRGSSGGTGSARAAPFDFARPRLRALAGALAPAWLRIGGSEADKVYYDLGPTPRAEADLPPGYALVFTRAELDALGDFAADLGLDVFMTLNAGPGPRDAQRRWQPDDARAFVRAAKDRVAAWELGNEVNAFPVIHGLDWRIDGAAFAADYRAAQALFAEEGVAAPLAAPSSAYWPLVGEPNPTLPDFMVAIGPALGRLTWHYYPQQSARCPLASREAGPWVMLDPDALDEVRTWADEVRALRDAHAPGADLWLGETGNAQCGGAAGVSDRFVSTFWWLDQLGLMARAAQSVVVRQTLAGADYGLIDDATLAPRPDYWASLLWKQRMGDRVLAVDVAPDHRLVRAYAHCARRGGGRVAVLVLNLDREAAVTFAVPALGAGPADLWRVTAPDPLGVEVRLGGAPLVASDDGSPPALAPERLADPIATLAPLSWAFMEVAGADVPACADP